MNTIKKYLYFVLIPVILSSCVKENPVLPDQKSYSKVGEGVSSASSFNLELYAADSLFVGYNKVYFKLKDNTTGKQIDHASLAIHPLMNMGTSSHACPVENPDTTLNTDGYFEGAVLFSMIGTNSWSLSVDVTVNKKTETVSFPISKVRSTDPVRKIVVIDSLSNGNGTWTITKYPVSLIIPSSWKVGNNPFEITIHKMASIMSFPCCNDISVEITPEMPSMGHGSPNNINPVSVGMGHYLGTVNFTMTGAWRINMVFKKGDRVINNKAYFDIIL